MSLNKLFNDLFSHGKRKKEEPKDDLGRLDDALNDLAHLLAPLRKSIGQGIRANHKYIKRTGSPGNYKYWYQEPGGQMYSSDKPQNPSDAGLNAGQENDFHKPKVVVVNVQAEKVEGLPKGWSHSSKVKNTMNHPQYGSITIRENTDGTRTAIHNGAPVKDYETGKTDWDSSDDFHSMLKNYIQDLGEQRVSQVNKRRVIVKKKD